MATGREVKYLPSRGKLYLDEVGNHNLRDGFNVSATNSLPFDTEKEVRERQGREGKS